MHQISQLHILSNCIITDVDNNKIIIFDSCIEDTIIVMPTADTTAETKQQMSLKSLFKSLFKTRSSGLQYVRLFERLFERLSSLVVVIVTSSQQLESTTT